MIFKFFTVAPNQALPARKQRDFADNAQQADGMSVGTLRMANVGVVNEL